MQKYAKFLMDILTNKKKLEDLSTVIMCEECSAVLDGKLSKKISDPRNRSIKYPRGIIENMLVKVDRFVFSMDFVILAMDEDSKVPLILGRPFLSTSRCLVDVYEKKMTLRVDDDEVIFYIDKSMKYSPKQDDALYYIDTIEPLVEENFQEIFEEDLFDTKFIGGEDMNMSNEEVLEELLYLIENDPSSRSNKEEEIKNGTKGKPKTSFEEPLVLELKDLSPHLEYAFLESESKLPVIISSDLT
ncbi:reverse transcriptase domain-containing protein [Tanacetum coccineum]